MVILKRWEGAAFGPRWVGTCIRVLLGLQRPAGSADVDILYIYIINGVKYETLRRVENGRERKLKKYEIVGNKI